MLADPESYGDWVVGSDTIRDADANWPAVGSRFHHRVGVGPLKINDHTEAVEVDPQRRLVMHARARPMGTALISMEWEPRDGGAWVTMKETAGDPLSHIAINPLTDWLVHLRNDESLRRLKRIAETGELKSS
ncbi:MAG: SRPBCC family protein [Actinomycetota bacterium]|nr:SRPBCC family protein [Actinomycetota bacterium]